MLLSVLVINLALAALAQARRCACLVPRALSSTRHSLRRNALPRAISKDSFSSLREIKGMKNHVKATTLFRKGCGCVTALRRNTNSVCPPENPLKRGMPRRPKFLVGNAAGAPKGAILAQMRRDISPRYAVTGPALRP